VVGQADRCSRAERAEAAYDAIRARKAAVEERQPFDPVTPDLEIGGQRADAVNGELLKLRFDAAGAHLDRQPLC